MDVVGVTEINQTWFDWLMGQPGFVEEGPFRGVHDGHDVAIFWDRFTVEPTNPRKPQVVHPNFLPSEIPLDDQARYSWRQFMRVEFKCLASPQVIFTAACTHSIAGSIEEGDRITKIKGSSSNAKNRNKSMIAMRAMEKALKHCHMPSLAAGNAKTFTIFMGDWNTSAVRMKEDVEDAITEARAAGVAQTVMTARGTEERDHVVCFSEHQHWHARRDDYIPAATIAALKGCIGKEHEPVFFG